jgi:hypothetical protein
LEAVTAALEEERTRTKVLRERLQSRLDVESLPRIADLESTVTRLREERDEAVEDKKKTKDIWSKILTRLVHYIKAVDPGKPTSEEAWAIIVGWIKDTEFVATPQDMVEGTPNDSAYAQLQNDIRRSHGKGRHIN